MNKVFASLGFKKQAKRLSQQDRERLAFEKHARTQFEKLRKKGLGIRIIVL